MAKKTRKLFAWIMVFTLIAGQLAIPAAAEGAPEQEVTVDVSAAVPEAPAAEPQAPAASESTSVSTSDPVTVSSDSGTGMVLESTSSTTTWSGDQNGTTTTGSETTTTVTGTDDVTGQTLYEGGSVEGSESSVTVTEDPAETKTEEGFVTQEVTTGQTTVNTESGSASLEETESSTASGNWTDVENGYTEGTFEQTGSEKKEDQTSTTLGEEEIPESGIVIQLAPGQNGTHSGSANGEIIPLEEGRTIPEGATLVKDQDGNVTGYILTTTTETVTGTETKDGEARLDQENSSTDTTGTTETVTPDLEGTAQQLGIHIDDSTRISEETNADGKVIAYVVTNTTEESYETDAIGQLTRPEAGTFPQEDGTTMTVTVEESRDAEGNAVITVVKVQTDADGNELSRNETQQTIIKNSLPEGSSVTTYTLPEKPEASVKTEDGITTTVTVTDITDADGNVIGYKSTTVRTDASGAELYREENDLYGTEETVTESVTTGNDQVSGTATVKVTTVETTRVTAEETVFNDIATYTRLNQIISNMTVEKNTETVMIDGKLYYIYTGSVNVTEGATHGDTSLMNPITPMGSLFKENEKLDLSEGHQGIWGVSSKKPEKGFKYIGSGVNTALTINKGWTASDVEQFRLISADGKVYYAMCIDFNTTIQGGHLYDIQDIREAEYLQQSGNEQISAAEKIRSVALNGYWGTESGVGSMADVQAFLKTYLEDNTDLSDKEVEDIIRELTPGQAQAATQAALWMFGNKDRDKIVNTYDLVGGDSKTDEKMVKYLFNALLNTANDPNAQLDSDEGVEFLDAEDITATSIVVKEKIVSAEDEGNTSGKNVYNTDLNFTLGIEPTKLFGDLKVTVYDNRGNEVKTVVLANKDTTLIGLKPDANGMYTISDIEIAEGVTVNLKLHGTQDLGTGVYIYTSLDGTFNDSQTLVTLATGSRKVDLDIAMRLDVQEPTVTRTTSTETQYGKRTDTQLQTRTEETQRSSTVTRAQWHREETAETESSQVFTTDVTLTSVTTRETKSERSWKFSWAKFFDPAPAPEDDDVPIPDPNPGNDGHGNNDPGNGPSGDETPTAVRTGLKKKMTIADTRVPLAKAPKTGDLSGIWAAISGLSLAGIALLNAKRREEE